MSRSRAGTKAFREVRTRGGRAGGQGARVSREARMPHFLGLDGPPGEVLDRLRVMILGAGSVGGQIAQHVARLQAREIWIVDPAKLKDTSLLTHQISPAAVGKPKAAYWGRLCKAISPNTRVWTFAGHVQSVPMTAFGKVDLAVMATDNLAAEIEVGQRCMRHGVPLIQASVHGDTLVAQVRYWSNRDGQGACPCCAFSDREWGHVSKETEFRCSGPDGRPVERAHVMPTMSVSFLCSMAADMAMMQAFRHVLHLGPPLHDSVTEYCGFTHRTTVSPLARNSQCRAEHCAWRTVEVARPLGASSLGRLARQALGRDDLPGDVAFTVGDDLAFVETALCCGWPQPVGRFCVEGRPAATCPRCGKASDPQSFFSHRPVSAAVLGPLVDRPLRRLGAGSATAVVVHADGQAVLCQEEPGLRQPQDVKP